MKRINALKIEDGKITLFQRDDVKSALWYANFQLGHGKRTLRALETTDRTVAEHKAKELYRKLLVRVDQDLPLHKLSFADFWDKKWLPYAEKRLSGHRYRLHEGTGRLYFKSYMANRSLDQVTTIVAEGYVDWRRDFWLNRSDRPKNSPDRPAKKSLQLEFGLLVQALTWAGRTSLMRPLGKMKAHTVKTDPDRKRRYGFNEDEWLKLASHMEHWQHDGRHRLHNTQRALLRRLIWCYYLTGLRRREMQDLKWNGVKRFGDGSRAEITVPADTKTGTRTTISQPGIFDYLPPRGADDEFVWPEGWEPHVSLRKLLDDIGLLEGPDGKARTIYSFRHTYATARLMQGVTYEDLSLNMGTAYTEIRKHYSHVVPQQRADAITKQEGFSAAEIINATNWLYRAAQSKGVSADDLLKQALEEQAAADAAATTDGRPANPA